MSLLLDVLLALVLVFVLMMLIAGPNRSRMRALKRSHPTSLILTAVTPRGSQVAGQELMRAWFKNRGELTVH
ncbi:hypothetical protein B7R21_16585 [Subtercola boreus]|uniref:Uncharacterized protein n=1 Tax=Subtercola boreus TaxID=120213 RepID=A0A3E0VCA5_9MICO|nr:hypothetical protein [Subtercola boreus]RFA07138.1 hypothetical protein B7R21_16585 [Subtercola boreus]